MANVDTTFLQKGADLCFVLADNVGQPLKEGRLGGGVQTSRTVEQCIALFAFQPVSKR